MSPTVSSGLSIVVFLTVLAVAAIGRYVGGGRQSQQVLKRLNEPQTPWLGKTVSRTSARFLAWCRSLRPTKQHVLTLELARIVESVAGLLRTGLSLPVALDVATREIFGEVSASMKAALVASHHLGLEVALETWADRLVERHRQAPVVARALLIVSHGGVGAATALDGLADGLRSTLEVEREVTALASQARLSGTVMALVPLGFAVLLAGTDANARAFLTASPIGFGCLVVGLTLDGLAWIWMRRLAVVRW
jgi:tight adherence protein B